MADYSAEDDDSILETEVESLRSIYIHELEIDYNGRRPMCVTVHLHPATADNLQMQYVRLSLIMKLPNEYPNTSPEILIRNPRGLSDEEIERISHDLYLKAEEKNGSPMLFELIEVAKEHLTLGNTPSCQCAICLYGFTESDVFTKTECYHYFHSHCLARYVRYILQKAEEEKLSSVKWVDKDPTFEVVCPVCRLPISYSDLVKGDFPLPCEENAEGSFSLTAEMKQLQYQMANLYKKQKSQGGIIDLDVEKKRYLLEISNTSGDTNKNVMDQAEACSPKYVSASNDEPCTISSAGAQGIQISDNNTNADVLHSENQAISPTLSEKSQTRSYGKHYNMGGRSRRSAGYRGKDEYRRKERDHRFRRHESFETDFRDEDKNVYQEVGDQLYSEETQSVSDRESNIIQERTDLQVHHEHNVNEFSESPDTRTDRYNAQHYPSTSKVHRGASSNTGTEFLSKHSFRGNRHSGHYRENVQKNRSSGSNFRSNHNSRKSGMYRGGRPFSGTHLRGRHSNNYVSTGKEDSSKDSLCKPQIRDDKASGSSAKVPVYSKGSEKPSKVNEPGKCDEEKSSVMCHLPRKVIGPPPGFAHIQNKVVYGPPVIKPPPGFGQR